MFFCFAMLALSHYTAITFDSAFLVWLSLTFLFGLPQYVRHLRLLRKLGLPEEYRRLQKYSVTLGATWMALVIILFSIRQWHTPDIAFVPT